MAAGPPRKSPDLHPPCTHTGRSRRSERLMTSPAAKVQIGSDLFAIVVRQIDAAARLMDLDPDMHCVLRTPKRILTVQVPIELEAGDVGVFTGYRVQHNINRGPAI